MTESAVLQCLKRRKRSIGKYFYVIIAAWTLILFINLFVSGSFKLRRNFYSKKSISNKKLEVKPVNVFEKWYLSNRRSLLVDENEEIQFKLTIYPTNGTVLRPKVEDILKYYGKQDAPTQTKVFNILEFLRFGPNPGISPLLNCEAILKGDTKAILNGKLANLELKSMAWASKRKELVLSSEDIVKMAKDCESYKMNRKYITIPLSKEEMAYPIAYIITIHRDLPSFEKLLRSIYHPQNIYCVHVDLKSDEAFQEGTRTIVNCFDNVFIATNLTSVRYTHWSRVQADLNCMKDLVKKAEEHPWRYVINLCGQDFPIKTNLEIVRALKNLQGFNNLETFKTPEHKKRRYEFHFELPSDPKNDHSLMKRTETKKSPPPYNIEMFAGSAYYVFKRQAVEYMTKDHIMQKFFEWEEDTYSPDENMWGTLQRMYPQLPGSFPPHEKYDLNELQTITRIIKWGGLDKKVYPKCEGRFVRGVCVFGCGDLAWLVSQKHLFANKFEPEIDVLSIHCLEDWVRNRTIDQSKMYYIRGYL